jgi:N-acetylmuramoyl-L-alanine amidase
MREINHIVIHASDTPADRDIDIEEVKKWHVEERGWSDVGYHFFIKLDGCLQFGRSIRIPGAHVSGHNSHSIGICYAGGWKGEDTRTPAQKKTMGELLDTLKYFFQRAEILGHRDFEGISKLCPGFDVKAEYGNV